MRKQGYFVVSLDFELLYGLSSLDNQPYWEESVQGGRKAVDRLLELFRAYGIHVTWATVGMLMAKNKQELQSFFPDRKPRYEKANYDVDRIGEDENDDPYHYAQSLIQHIRETPHQEIGTHTFSHYFCTEDGQCREDFCDDIDAAVRIAAEKGIALKSIVLPKNQVVSEYISELERFGIIAYRGNETSSLHCPSVKETLWKRGRRFLDSYVNLSGMHCYDLHRLETVQGIVNIPASRFLRPFSPKLRWLEGLKTSRIKGQMKHAAKYGLIFHLWWHPHNFGRNTDKNVRNLKRILNYYQKLNEKYGFESANMQEIAEMRNENCHFGLQKQ